MRMRNMSGDGIKTGNISSPNLTTSVGSTFSLSDGIIKIGGMGNIHRTMVFCWKDLLQI